MSFGSELEGGDEPMSDINMTPLVDVMLVLLIIFMITVPVLTHSVKLDLPRAANTPDQVKPQTVTISVTADAQVFRDQTPVGTDDLDRRLTGIATQRQQPEVHIRGDRMADYEHVIRVMAAVQRAGVLKLGFITEPDR